MTTSRHRNAAGVSALAVALLLGSSAVGTAAHAAPPAEGIYQGTSTLLMAGEKEVDWEDVRPISFQVSGEGLLHGLSGEYFWTCIAGGEPGTTAFFEDAPIPDTLVEVGEPFAINWTSGGEAVSYTLEGVINSDGSADGMVMANVGVCGATILSWNVAMDAPAPVEVTAQAPAREGNTVTIPVVDGVTYVDGDNAELSGTITLTEGEALTVTATADDGYVLAEGTHEWVVEYEDDTPTPVEVTAQAPAREGNTVTIPVVEGVTYVDGDNAELSGTITLTEGEALTVTATADDGYVLAEGTHEWVFEYEDQTPAPETIPGVAPSEDDLDAALEGAITAPDEAQAGDTVTIAIDGAYEGDKVGVWRFSTPVYLGSQIIDADGNVTVSLPVETAVGEHKIAAWNGADEALIGWDTIAIVTDDGDGGEDPGGNGGNDGSGRGSGDGNHGNGSSSNGDLAATGSAGAGATVFAALLLLVTGAWILVLRRRATA